MRDQRLLDIYENAVAVHNPDFIIGIDEVGWGALAGPLILGCTVYKPDFHHLKVKDSKAFTTEKSRQIGFEVVNATALYTDLHTTSVQQMSALGASAVMKAALFTVATKAILHYPKSLVVVDGAHPIRGLQHPQVAISKADTFVPAVGAASIIAKVTRDQYMTQIGNEYPEFEWYANKGYPTQKHLRMLRQHGVTEHHRLNIALVGEALTRHGTYEAKHYGEDCEEGVGGY